MKKRVLREQIAATRRICALLDHPRPPWQDESTEQGDPFWRRDACPCGVTGARGTNVRPHELGPIFYFATTEGRHETWPSSTVRCTCPPNRGDNYFGACPIHDVTVFS